MSEFYLNGTSGTDLGLVALSFADWWSLPPASRGSARAYGQMGTHPADQATYEARLIPIATAAETASVTARRTAVDEVLTWARGLQEFAIADDTTRVGYCVVEEIPIAARWESVAWTNPQARADLMLTFYDVCKYASQVDAIHFGATPVTVPLGNAPSWPIITVHGAGSTAIVRVRQFGGAELHSFTLASLATDEALVVDTQALSATFYDSGVVGTAAAGLAKITAGFPFALDPDDAPTIEVTAGWAEMSYRRRWLS